MVIIQNISSFLMKHKAIHGLAVVFCIWEMKTREDNIFMTDKSMTWSWFPYTHNSSRTVHKTLTQKSFLSKKLYRCLFLILSCHIDTRIKDKIVYISLQKNELQTYEQLDDREHKVLKISARYFKRIIFLTILFILSKKKKKAVPDVKTSNIT